MFASCSQPSAPVKLYGWTTPGNTEENTTEMFSQFKSHGLTGVCCKSYNVESASSAARIAHALGLEYHAWIGAMTDGSLDSTLYAINRNGESAYNKPVYVSYYKFLCPQKKEVFQYLGKKYGDLADIPEVDFVHLDYIRFPDVILARGLWEKYGLVMNEEYAPADYCYCDQCVGAFKTATGIDIKSLEDPSTCKEWKQFRYDQITHLVNHIAGVVHAKGKKISAAVFPGPELAKKLVRQEWNKWDIDAVFPMNYNDFYLEGAGWLAEICKEETAAVGNKIPVYSGLFICRDWQHKADIKDPEGHGLLPSEIEEAVLGSLRSGAAGICLYTPGRMTEEHWQAFDKAVKSIK
ncbi:MAG: hypothetical protein LBN11_01805 [Tannerella sp.]|nr:hypothetical protein [Tannerella sp.]